MVVAVLHAVSRREIPSDDLLLYMHTIWQVGWLSLSLSPWQCDKGWGRCWKMPEAGRRSEVQLSGMIHAVCVSLTLIQL